MASQLKCFLLILGLVCTAMVAAFVSPDPGKNILRTSCCRRTPSATTTLLRETASPQSSSSSADQFQAKLLELQSAGIPLLGCDATAVHTMSTGLWNTIADVIAQDDATQVCMIFNDIPVSALQSFVQDFAILQTQDRLMQHLVELQRLDIRMLDPDSPALLIATTEPRNDAAERAAEPGIGHVFDAQLCTNALTSFIQRIVIQENACPYTKSVQIAAVGLESKGIQSGPVGYRFSDTSNAARALAVFWQCVSELLETPETDISTTMLSLPAIGAGQSAASLARFAAVMEVISRYLCLYRGDASFGLVHFHPAYDRTAIHPIDKPAYGHLPPRSWLRPMMIRNGHVEQADALSDDDLALSDYQRRAPFTAINILRASQLNAASGPKSIVTDLEVRPGVYETASGLVLYSRNAMALAAIGKERLDAGLAADIALYQPPPQSQPLQESA